MKELKGIEREIGAETVEKVIGTGLKAGTETEIDQVIGIVMVIHLETEEGMMTITQGVVIEIVHSLTVTIFLMAAVHHMSLREIDFYECSRHH